MGKSTISMAIFNSYVTGSLPEGIISASKFYIPIQGPKGSSCTFVGSTTGVSDKASQTEWPWIHMAFFKIFPYINIQLVFSISIVSSPWLITIPSHYIPDSPLDYPKKRDDGNPIHLYTT